MQPYTAVLAISLFLAPTLSSATTYYVSLTGSDSASCGQATRPDSARRTIAAGLGCLSAGDTLYIRGGTYQESIDDTQVTIPSGTSWDNPVTIASAPGETATLLGRVSIRDQPIQYVIFDRLTVDGGGSPNNTEQTFTVLQFAFQSHLKFQNGEIRNANDQLITGGRAATCTS